MCALSNPDLLTIQFESANWWMAWRGRAGELIFLAIALLAFLGFGLWLADSWWSLLLNPTAPWAKAAPAMALGVISCGAFLVHARITQLRLLAQQQGDWLSALPVATDTRDYARARALAQRLLLAGLACITLLFWGSLRATVCGAELLSSLGSGIATGCLMGAYLPAWRMSYTAGTQRSAGTRVALPVPDAVRGLALLGAVLEPAAARLPKTAPWVGASFLLFPPSTPFISLLALLVLLTTASLLLDLVSHWRARYLVDVHWLAAEALSPRRLFVSYLPPLLKRSLVGSVIFGACLHAIGAPLAVAGLMTLVLAGAMANAVLCGFATRRQPGRYPLLLMVHAVLVIASVQVLPPAAPIVLLGCAFSAWRKGNT